MINRILERIKIYSLFALRRLLQPSELTLNGVRINIEHEGIPDQLRRFFYLGSYEGDEVRILTQVLQSSDRVMEIGAGIGYLSTYCAKLVGSSNVTAFEANPALIDKIEATYHLNGVSPEVRNTLSSDESGSQITFYVEPSFWSSSTHKRSESAQEVKVTTSNINHVIQELTPSMLLIDIEGGEAELVEMIDFDCSSIDKIIIELHPHVIGDSTCSRVLKVLFEQGFDMNFSMSRFPVLYLTRHHPKS